ncbi:tubulin/FtsZ family with GTPase domain [Chitinophaga dinghuensis]|uniref:Tubulin/FtsZ family with GTPase domain n=1 Tax=Chitinophaga dinghuensis TaxID=1539050 RepID=A0A327W6G0_9BACT|nr:restriction endonuclease [Chitinophaga dinghuensis]RAJ83604.1 tubulin/FtsZ family with GTPase domain [Chitinophaga dinghuensis]
MNNTVLNYKVFGIGNAGSRIVSHLKEKGLPPERLFYIDTDRRDFGRNTLNNKFLFAEELLGGYGTLGNKDKGREAFLQDRDLFERLAQDKCLYIVVGGLGGGTFSGFASIIAELLSKDGKQCVFITTFPAGTLDRTQRFNALDVLSQINDYTDKLILLGEKHISSILGTHGKPDGYEIINKEIASILEQLLSAKEDKIIKCISGPECKVEEAIERICVYIHKNKFFVSLRESKMMLKNILKSLLGAIRDRPEHVHKISSRRFEEIVAYIYEAAGYRTELTPATRDHGVDIKVWTSPPIIGEDLLNIVQTKQQRKMKVGESEVRAMVGAKVYQKAERGVIVTTSGFSKSAIQAAKHEKIDLLRFYELSDAAKEFIK